MKLSARSSLPKRSCGHQLAEPATTNIPHHLVEECLDHLHALVSGQQEGAMLFLYVLDYRGGSQCRLRV